MLVTHIKGDGIIRAGKNGQAVKLLVGKFCHLAGNPPTDPSDFIQQIL